MIGPSVGMWLLAGSPGVLFADMPSIELDRLPIRGDTGFEDIRRGMFGGEDGVRAETNEEVLFVFMDDVSLEPILPFSRDGDGGSNGESRGELTADVISCGKEGDEKGDGCRISLLPCSNLSAKLLRYGDSPFSPITPNSEMAELPLPSFDDVGFPN